MIRHDHVAAQSQPTGRSLPSLGQHALESEVVGSIIKNSLPRGGAIEDVVSQTTGTTPTFAGHKKQCNDRRRLSQNVFSVPDPLFFAFTDISRPDRKILIIEVQQEDRLDFDYMAVAGLTTLGTETPDSQYNFAHRHLGKGNQCFADGHVELMPPIAYYLPWQAGSDAFEYLDLFHNPGR